MLDNNEISRIAYSLDLDDQVEQAQRLVTEIWNRVRNNVESGVGAEIFAEYLAKDAALLIEKIRINRAVTGAGTEYAGVIQNYRQEIEAEKLCTLKEMRDKQIEDDKTAIHQIAALETLS